MQPQEKTSLERNLPLEISYYFYEGSPEFDNDYDAPIPAEPASVDVTSLKLWGVDLINFIPEKTLQQLIERLLEDHCNE